MAADFRVVAADLFPAGRPNTGRKPTDETLALERGEVVFRPGVGSWYANRYRTTRSYLAKRGFRIESRQGELDGTPGLFMRAVKL